MTWKCRKLILKQKMRIISYTTALIRMINNLIRTSLKLSKRRLLKVSELS